MLGGSKQVTVEVKQRTLTIADQVYQLCNIARVQRLKFKPNRLRILGRFAKRALPVVVGLVLNHLVYAVTRVRVALVVFDALGLGVLAVLAFMAASAASRRAWHVLLLKSTGAPFSVLFSKELNVVQRAVA